MGSNRSRKVLRLSRVLALGVSSFLLSVRPCFAFAPFTPAVSAVTCRPEAVACSIEFAFPLRLALVCHPSSELFPM